MCPIQRWIYIFQLFQLHILTTNSRHFELYIDETLQQSNPVPLHQAITQVNISVTTVIGPDTALLTTPLNQIRLLLKTWSFYKNQSNAFTSIDGATLLMIPCDRCEWWVPIPSICANLCYDSIMEKWSTCAEYTTRMNAYNNLLVNLVYPNKQVVFLYDPDREVVLNPVMDTILEHLKVIIWDTSKIHCPVHSNTCQLPLRQRTLNSISNYILSTKLNWRDIIHQKRNYINLLGPDNNWLIDDRFHDDNQVNKAKLLVPYTEGGNYVTIISGSPDSNTVQEMVTTMVGQQYPDNNTHITPWTAKYLLLQTSNKNIKQCMVPEPVTKTCFDEATKQEWNLNSIFPMKFQGFYGRTLSVVTKTYPPFVKFHKLANGTTYYSGLVIDLLDSLAEALNFRYNLTEIADGKFGICEKWNGTCKGGKWNGMIGVLHRKEADIAATGLTMDAMRETVVDFTFPFWEEPSAVLVRRTVDGIGLLWVYKPFHLYVWITICVTIITIAFILTLFAKLECCMIASKEPMNNISNSLWYIFGAFLQQGGFHQPKTNAGQMLASMWWLVIVIIYGIYTGNLIAFLSVTTVSMPFNTLQEMISQNEYKYGMEDGFIQVMVFKTATSGIYYDIWKGVEAHPGSLVPNIATGLYKVKHEKYALIADKTYLQTLSINDCDLSVVKEEFYKVGFGLAVQEGWPYKKYFDDAILKLVEAGFIERWRQKHFPVDQCDLRVKIVKSKSISISDMSGNFSTLLFGIVFSVLVLLIEVCISKIQKKNRYDCNLGMPHTESTDKILIRSKSTDDVLFKVTKPEPYTLTDKISIKDNPPTIHINSEIKPDHAQRRFNINSFLFKPGVHRSIVRRSQRKRSIKQITEDKINIDLQNITRQSSIKQKTTISKNPLELL